MAHAVVDRLEPVEVEHHEAERLAGRDQRVHVLAERAVVEQAREHVRLCPAPDVEVDLGVLQRDRRLRREQLDELVLVVREQAAFPEPLHGEHADRTFAPAEGHADEAAVDRATGSLRDPVVVVLVVDPDRLVVLEHPRCEAGLAGRPRLHVEVGVRSPGHDRRQRAELVIEQLDGDIVGADELVQPGPRGFLPAISARRPPLTGPGASITGCNVDMVNGFVEARTSRALARS